MLQRFEQAYLSSLSALNRLCEQLIVPAELVASTPQPNKATTS